MQADRAAYNRQVLRAIVYENPHAANPLPRDIFTGPFDEQWGRSGETIERVYIGDELRTLLQVEHDVGLDRNAFQRHLQNAPRRRRA